MPDGGKPHFPEYYEQTGQPYKEIAAARFLR